ncbi:hypothetical protein [Streptomyces sp. G1]|uniref:hypothetical protein n=1 Tax=Streptomyces sp. G1 TaxID=361572 RepID=UPI0020301D96|nr:hypothetical protein [Streptomyces sp. G1]MCM1964900.1 hypothetical protein [Streptomyces sp. G1]
MRPLWEAAVEHVRKSGCGMCRSTARLPQLCPDGQRLVGEVLGVLCVMPPADPLWPSAAAHFADSVREQCAADIVRFADLMEVHGQGMPAVSRDAYYVRYASRIIRDGLAAHILPAPRSTAGENFLTEVSRLREELVAERADKQAAEDWANTLAYAVAPEEELGRHDEGRFPWVDALEMLTPAAEVKELRLQLLDLKRGRGPVGKCGRELATGQPCPDHPAPEASPTAGEVLAAREAERAHLLSLLPTAPPPEQGLPNQLAEAWGAYGVWEQVAHALGVELPYVPGGEGR